MCAQSVRRACSSVSCTWLRGGQSGCGSGLVVGAQTKAMPRGTRRSRQACGSVCAMDCGGMRYTTARYLGSIRCSTTTPPSPSAIRRLARFSSATGYVKPRCMPRMHVAHRATWLTASRPKPSRWRSSRIQMPSSGCSLCSRCNPVKPRNAALSRSRIAKTNSDPSAAASCHCCQMRLKASLLAGGSHA